MSDEETFESADAGASHCIPIKAGDLKKGSYAVIKGKPCKIEEITTSKTGKHGHAKANYYGYCIFTGKRCEDVAPTSHNVLFPIVERLEYILTDINEQDINEDGAICTLMEIENGNTREDLRVPLADEYQMMRDALADGSKDVIVTVVSAMGTFKVDPQFVLKEAGKA